MDQVQSFAGNLPAQLNLALIRCRGPGPDRISCGGSAGGDILEKLMEPSQPQLDPNIAAERLKVVDASLRLANRSVMTAGLSWAKTSVAIALMCLATYALEHEIPPWLRWALIAAIGAILSYVLWQEVQRYQDMRRAPNLAFRTYTRMYVVASVFATVLIFAVEAGWIDELVATCFAFLAVGGLYLMHGPFLRHGGIWLAVFSIPWAVAAMLVFVLPRAELLLIAALACVTGGVVPGLIVHRRANAIDWTGYGSDRQSS